MTLKGARGFDELYALSCIKYSSSLMDYYLMSSHNSNRRKLSDVLETRRVLNRIRRETIFSIKFYFTDDTLASDITIAC